MASTTSGQGVDREIARAREPLPVGPPSTLSRDIERSIDRTEGDKLFGNGSKTKSNGNGKGHHDQLLNFDSASFQPLLRLRKKVQVKPRLTADLGLDLNPLTQKIRPVGSLNFQMRAKDDRFANLRISHRRAVVTHKHFVDLDRVKIPFSCNVTGAAGFDWHGTPDFGFSVGDVRPRWVPVVAGVVALALRQPLSGSRTFGSAHFKDPIEGDAMGEVRASVKRSEGLGLTVGLNQLNLVMRF